MPTVFQARQYGWFKEIKGNLRREKRHRTNQGFDFQSNLEKKEIPSILKDDSLQEEAHSFLHKKHQR